MPTSAIRACSFESRRQTEMAMLIRKFGGEPTVAPSLKEAPVEANGHVFEFGRSLLAGEYDCVVFLTGVGTTALFDTLQAQIPEADILSALDKCRIVVRGPKPTAVLRARHVRIDHAAPEPNTWRELIATLDEAHVDLQGQRIAVQEYGAPSEELYSALRDRGAVVTSVPVYRWQLPDDLDPLESAIRRTVAGEFDILFWTSAQQVVHVVEVAERLGLKDAWLFAARKCMIASIGPVASERLEEYGLIADLEPSHPKMAHLVREAIERYDSFKSKNAATEIGPFPRSPGS